MEVFPSLICNLITLYFFKTILFKLESGSRINLNYSHFPCNPTGTQEHTEISNRFKEKIKDVVCAHSNKSHFKFMFKIL